MKKISILLLAAAVIAACCNQSKSIVIEKQGVFSSGGTVTAPIPGDYDPTQNWRIRAGNSHFMFQELNNAQLADLVADWLAKHNLK